MGNHTESDAERNIDDIDHAIRGALAFGADPVDVADAVCLALNTSRLTDDEAKNLRWLLVLAANGEEA